MGEHEEARVDVSEVPEAERVTLPEPLPVYVKLASGEETQLLGWACPECMLFHSGAIYACRPEEAQAEAKRFAAECCHRRCRDCGCDMGKSAGYLACGTCRAKNEQRRDQERIDKAKHIRWEDYHQRGVYSADLDEYYFEMDGLDDDLIDAHTECRLDLDENVPVLWALRVRPLKMDAYNIVDGELQDHHDEAMDDVSGKHLDRLQRMLDKWCKDVGVESFEIDYSTIVDMPEGWIESLRKEVAAFREEMSE